ncbi:hypothetical protein ACF1GS_15310 [Streptomyces eurythermus]|uniref:hypothetical protein n=1 Tax=Streptomyces eurythermus TaxID=42237 RepID=UPI0037016723
MVPAPTLTERGRTGPDPAVIETDTGRPRPARMYDRCPGGKDNHPLDEAMGRQPPAPDRRPRTAGPGPPGAGDGAGRPRLPAREEFPRFVTDLDLVDPAWGSCTARTPDRASRCRARTTA